MTGQITAWSFFNGDDFLLFEFTDKLKEIKITDLNLKNNTVAFLSGAEFEAYHDKLGFSQSDYEKYGSENKYFRSAIEVHEDYSFGTLKIIEPDIDDKNEIHLAFYIKKSFVLIVGIKDSEHSALNRFAEAVHRFSAKDFLTEKFIFAFIDSLIKNDNKGLEDIELQINKMEDKVLKEFEYKNFNEELLTYKRKLLDLRNYYEQLIDIGEALSENENRLFNEENLRYFKIFTQKADRLCTNVNILRDNISQLKETYQSSLDLKLNNTMKFFTVITAVFLPLTLIVGWYGMNFKYMPELNWRYGYLFVITLSVVVVSVFIYIFKRKKLM